MVCESSFYYNDLISYCISSEFIIMIIMKNFQEFIELIILYQL